MTSNVTWYPTTSITYEEFENIHASVRTEMFRNQLTIRFTNTTSIGAIEYLNRALESVNREIKGLWSVDSREVHNTYNSNTPQRMRILFENYSDLQLTDEALTLYKATHNPPHEPDKIPF